MLLWVEKDDTEIVKEEIKTLCMLSKKLSGCISKMSDGRRNNAVDIVPAPDFITVWLFVRHTCALIICAQTHTRALALHTNFGAVFVLFIVHG